MPQVSVGIPGYNAARYLPEAVDSVLGQTFRDLELIVVDDGSTDNTRAVLDTYGDRLRYLYQENQGLSRARNRTVRESRADLVALLDADDYWLPEKLERQVGLLEQHPEAVACFTLTEQFQDGGQVIGCTCSPHFPDLVEALLTEGTAIGPPSSALIRKDALLRVGLFDTELSQCHDWDMWLRLLEVGPIVYVDEVLTRYRVHGSNMSRNVPLLEHDTLAVLRKFFAAPENGRYRRIKRRAYGIHWMMLSGSYLAAGRRRDSIRCLARGLACYPPAGLRALGLPARRVGRWLRQGSRAAAG